MREIEEQQRVERMKKFKEEFNDTTVNGRRTRTTLSI